MAPLPPPGMMPVGVQDIVRWARWKVVNQGHLCSILKPVALSPTRFLVCIEFKGGDGKEEGERGIPGSLEGAFDSILFWGCRFSFPSAGLPALLL